MVQNSMKLKWSIILVSLICSLKCEVRGQLIINPYIQSSFPAAEAFGDIYSQTSWADLADFSANTTTATIVGDKIQLSGGAGVFSQRLQLDYTTALESFIFKVDFVPGAKSATSYGLCLSFRSNNTWGSQAHSFTAQLYNATGSPGQIYCYTSGDAMATYVTRVNVASGVTWNDTDVVEFILERQVNVFYIRVRNKTTGGAQYSTSFTFNIASAAVPVMPNTGHLNLINMGGTMLIEGITLETTEKKYARIAIVGDSKTSYNAISVADRWPNILEETYTDITVLAGASSRTAEILTIVPEIIAFAPRQVLLNIGRNDIASGVAEATREANYASIVTQLEAAGITVKHLLPIEADNVDQSTMESFINSTYAAADVIASPAITAPDLVHPDVAGHASIASTVVSSGKIE